MSVQQQTPFNTYTGNGVTTVFPYQFKVLAAADLSVYVAGALKVLNVDYTVAGVGADIGGSITFISGAPAAGAGVSIIRAMKRQRVTDYQQQGDFNTPTVNPDFDNAILLIQDLGAQLGRSITTPLDEVATLPTLPSIANRSGKYIAFDAAGQPIASSGTGNDTALRTDLASTTAGGDGALLVGVRRAEAGSVARTVAAKLREVISVRDFGAVLDGVADDTLAFDQAITAANLLGGGEVVFDRPTKVRNITLKDKVSILGIGNPTMLVDAAASTDVAINAVGTLGVAINLNANAAQGATAVSVASAVGLAKGDTVLVREDTFVSGAVGRKHEINRIADIAGGTITLSNRLLEAFTTAASAQIIKLNPVSSFTCRGFTIKVASGAILGGGINLQYCTDFDINGVTIVGTYSAAAIKTTTCAFGNIRGNIVRDTQGGTPGGSNGLGLYITEATHNLIISDNVFSNFAQNSIETRSRHIQFIANNCRGSADVAINTHGNGVAHCLIANNEIDGCGGHGISVGFSAHVAGDSDITVRGNRIRNTAKNGISVAGAVAKENRRIIIEENDIEAVRLNSIESNAGIFFDFGIEVQALNNRIYAASVGNDPVAGITLSNATRARIAGNRIRDVSNGRGVDIVSCSNYVIEENYFDNISSSNIATALSTGTNYVRNNRADDTTVDIEASVWEGGNTWDYLVVTGTLVGLTTAPTDTVSFERHGWTVRVNIRSGASATSNTAALSMSFAALPSSFNPVRQQRINGISVVDNSANALGRVTVEIAGGFTFAKDFDGAAFTNAGTKGVNKATFNYALD